MQERKAVHYGQVELIPGIICDVYILNDGTPVMSENGAADLLGIGRMALHRIEPKWPPKTLRPFIGGDFGIEPKSVINVTAKNSPCQGRNITVYTSSFIESFIRGYSLALANRKLRPNQKHIGERCVVLQSALARSAIDTVIEQACGITPNIQQTVQEQCIKLMKQFGLKASFPKEEIYWSEISLVKMLQQLTNKL